MHSPSPSSQCGIPTLQLHRNSQGHKAFVQSVASQHYLVQSACPASPRSPESPSREPRKSARQTMASAAPGRGEVGEQERPFRSPARRPSSGTVQEERCLAGGGRALPAEWACRAPQGQKPPRGCPSRQALLALSHSPARLVLLRRVQRRRRRRSPDSAAASVAAAAGGTLPRGGVGGSRPHMRGAGKAVRGTLPSHGRRRRQGGGLVPVTPAPMPERGRGSGPWLPASALASGTPSPAGRPVALSAALPTAPSPPPAAHSDSQAGLSAAILPGEYLERMCDGGNPNSNGARRACGRPSGARDGKCACAEGCGRLIQCLTPAERTAAREEGPGWRSSA